ncbi:hypothetical protein ABZ565_29250 [Streptomyces sp. NPDC016469]|uniref:hypothetical protein n=1 Tax=Streptomyces sp. NPDC016469 TaxID=3157191 RepID=UPI0033E4B75C
MVLEECVAADDGGGDQSARPYDALGLSECGLHLADRLREPTHRRTRVRYNALLAERLWAAGRMEEAVATWNAVLDDYPHVQSGRCDDRIRTLISTTAPRTTSPLARDLHDRAKTALNHSRTPDHG